MVAEFVAEGGRAQDWRPGYSVAPSQPAPIVREHESDGTLVRELELATWGLRPGWAKPGTPAPINARIETAASKGMFAGAFASQRCLVPMAPGYFEWVAQPDGKQPFLIHGEGMLAAAGLYAARKVDDVWQVSYTIITREAVDADRQRHPRMPVFLEEAHWGDWLSPIKLGDVAGTLDMLEASSSAIAGTMHSFPVTRELNNTRTVNRNDPALVTPLS
jgi:putative SOS response-associated peptidase YedK